MGWADKYIDELRKGNTVEFCPRGNSMTPKIRDAQEVTIIPVELLERPLKVGDIVLCTVHGNQYLHLIKAIQDNRFLIGNNHGRINGWTSNIHGVYIKRK
jgi:hypothetical protein